MIIKLSFPEYGCITGCNLYNSLIISTNCGAGGIRTLVQTGKPYVFYMLILDFIFELWQDPSHQPQPYPLKSHYVGEAQRNYFRFNRTALPKSLGTTAFERCLVLLPGSGIKPVIYCTSIRQRERSCFRQINC